MKKYMLIVFMLSISFTISAKKDSLFRKNIHFSFGLDCGAAVPEGDFASGAWGQFDPGSGYQAALVANAGDGFCYDIFGCIRYKSIGIMFQSVANSNSFDQSSSNIYPQNGSGFGYIPVQNGTFITKEYLVGPYFSYSLGIIKIEFKLLFGNVSSNYPTLTNASAYPSSPNFETFQNGNGFGTCIGAKIKCIILKDRLGIGFGINYIGSDMVYNWSGGDTIDMSMGILQITCGLSLDL